MRILPFWVAVTAILATLVSLSQGKSSSEGLLLEFNERAVVLNDLEGKFKQYITSPTNDKELRQALEQDFIQSFQTLFKKTDEWILHAMMTNDVGKNLLRAELTRNENHLSATKAFLDRVVKAFNAAIVIHKRIIILLEGNFTQILELEKQGLRGFESVRAATMSYLTQVAWKGQFHEDTKKLAAKFELSGHLEKTLVDFLKQKYPFRSWLVLSRKRTTQQWVTCPLKKLESLELPVHGGKMMLVVSVSTDRSFNGVSASSHLAKVRTESAYLVCRSRARDIFNEMKLNCATTGHAFVATVGFTDDRSLPVIVTSNPMMMRSKRLLRTWWVFCRRYYLSVIFG